MNGRRFESTRPLDRFATTIDFRIAFGNAVVERRELRFFKFAVGRRLIARDLTGLQSEVPWVTPRDIRSESRHQVGPSVERTRELTDLKAHKKPMANSSGKTSEHRKSPI